MSILVINDKTLRVLKGVRFVFYEVLIDSGKGSGEILNFYGNVAYGGGN